MKKFTLALIAGLFALTACPEDVEPECAEDIDCQLSGSFTTAGCDTCAADEACAVDSLGATYCIVEADDQAICDDPAVGGTLTTVDLDGGGTGETCLGDEVCSAEGTCG
jgi:hypothetical protein